MAGARAHRQDLSPRTALGKIFPDASRFFFRRTIFHNTKHVGSEARTRRRVAFGVVGVVVVAVRASRFVVVAVCASRISVTVANHLAERAIV
jgi:hypothetical protein